MDRGEARSAACAACAATRGAGEERRKKRTKHVGRLPWAVAVRRQHVPREVADGALQLLGHHLCNVQPKIASQATRLLCMLCEGSVVATEEVISILAERLDLGLRHFSYLPHNELFSTEVHLLCELCAIQDDLWARRLQLLLTTVFKGMAFLTFRGY